ncbi:hypothetical protein H2200_006679 [Cladophialophora chaetospira]|uniref:Uncharacterized protein n=1 Tax=Cladophialophora chaetospira TaxID=386627 RepID=A0AA39CHY5_9EURO|nr:hypothetical protein H2200_006679 [Cladophialophora chaetospira]
MPNAMEKEKSNAVEKIIETEQPSEPPELPPPYVDPIPIPEKHQPSTTQQKDFSGHPGARGKPAEKDQKDAVGDIDGVAIGGTVLDKKEKAGGYAKEDHSDDSSDFMGVFRME